MPPTAIALTHRKERRTTAAFFFLSGILTATWTSRIPDVQQKLGLNNAAWGTVLFAIPAGLIAGLTVASWLIAKYGPRLITLVSCLLISLSLFVTGIASTTAQLMVVLFLAGICRTVLNISINTSAVDVQRYYHRPIISTFHGVWSLACFVAAGVSTVMIIFFVSPAAHFLAIALLCSLLAFLLLKKRVVYRTAEERRPFFVKPDRYLFLLGLLALCSMLCEGAMFDWSIQYFASVIKVHKSFVTVGYSSFIIAMAAGRLFGDKLTAAFGTYAMLMADGLLMVVGFAVAAFFPLLLPAAAGFLLIGIGDATLVPIIYTLASKSGKMPPSYALSSVTLIGYTGFLLGPLLIGNVSQKWGMQTAYFFLCIISVAIIFLAYKIKGLMNRTPSVA